MLPRTLLALLPLSLGLTMQACTCQSPTSDNSPPALRKASKPPTRGFVAIEPGTFMMGSSDKEEARYTNERQHKVTLTRAYEIASTELTQAQFQELMGYNPSERKDCPRCPVENVNWHEALAYCNAMSKKAGFTACYSCRGNGVDVKCGTAPAFRGAKIYDCPGYRLPTDAEWEYAYRAGTKTTYYNGDNSPETRVTCREQDPIADEIGWYCQNSGLRSHEVGGKKPNAWGLYDMAGNVWEWCHDQYLAVIKRAQVDPWGISDSPMRVVRGGSWRYFSRGMRAACRAWYKPYYRGNKHGFRPARTL